MIPLLYCTLALPSYPPLLSSCMACGIENSADFGHRSCIVRILHCFLAYVSCPFCCLYAEMRD